PAGTRNLLPSAGPPAIPSFPTRRSSDLASGGAPAQGSDPPASAIAISHSFGPDTQRMLAARLHAVFQPASGEARAVRRGSRGPCIYNAAPSDRRQPHDRGRSNHGRRAALSERFRQPLRQRGVAGRAARGAQLPAAL